jgi:ankyrin repeat protein
MKILRLFLFLLATSSGFGILQSMEKKPSKLSEAQIKLNRDLSNSLVRVTSTVQAVIELLKQGADPNYYLEHQLQYLLTLLVENPRGDTEIKDNAGQKAVALLLYGADPNIQDFLLRTFVDKLVQLLSDSRYQRDDTIKIFRNAILFGGKPYMVKGIFKRALDEALALAFPQKLLKAIALQDIKHVKQILANTPVPIVDSDGISALAYAAGQGNLEMVNLFLLHPAYKYDVASIELALEIIEGRLRGLQPTAPTSTESMLSAVSMLPLSYVRKALAAATSRIGWQTEFTTYEQYQEIAQVLKNHLEKMIRGQLQVFTDQALVENTKLPQMPEEIQQEIFNKLFDNQNIFKQVFWKTS